MTRTDWLYVKDVAERAARAPRTIHWHIAQGNLVPDARDPYGHPMFKPRTVEAWLATNRMGRPTKKARRQRAKRKPKADAG